MAERVGGVPGTPRTFPHDFGWEVHIRVPYIGATNEVQRGIRALKNLGANALGVQYHRNDRSKPCTPGQQKMRRAPLYSPVESRVDRMPHRGVSGGRSTLIISKTGLQ